MLRRLRDELRGRTQQNRDTPKRGGSVCATTRNAQGRQPVAHLIRQYTKRHRSQFPDRRRGGSQAPASRALRFPVGKIRSSLPVGRFRSLSIGSSIIVCISPQHPSHRLWPREAESLKSHQDIRIVVPFETRHSHQFTNPGSYKHSIATQWVPTARADPGMLSGVLLYACRSLYILTSDQRYYELALHYKLDCLRLLQEAISSSSMNATIIDAIIPRALQLASDELALGDVSTCKSHMDAVVRMVVLKGGMEKIDAMHGFLRQMVSVFACSEQLQAADRAIQEA